MAIDLEKIVLNMKKYRKHARLTQEELSEAAELSPDYISLIERGKRYPSLKSLFKIAEALGIEAYKLIKFD